MHTKDGTLLFAEKIRMQKIKEKESIPNIPLVGYELVEMIPRGINDF